jgi:hypothetical protein
MCLALLAAPHAARAADASIWSRDLPLPGSRVPAALSTQRPFDMVGLHWRGRGAVVFRTHGTGGWSAWHRAAPEAEDLPDPGSEQRRGGWQLGNPWWAPRSDRLEVRTRGDVTRLRAWFVVSQSARIPLRRVSIASSPKIVPRAGWAANEKIVRAAPRYAPVLHEAIIHHTAGANSYRPEDSAAIVRGIELYHVKANGWNDIGYNFLVDRFGQVFEGRGGGIDRNVIGAHAEGFNTGSVGIALIGTYSSIASLLAWRLDVAHLDPSSSSMVASGGNPRFRAGMGVYLRAVSGHRDTGFTDCPGNRLYGRLPALMEVAATTGLPKLYDPLRSGAFGKTVRFSARLSERLAWTVTVRAAGGTQVARKTGIGDRVSWLWNSAGLPGGRYTWTIEAGPSVRPARGTIVGKSVAPPVAPPPPPSPPPPPPPPPAKALTASPAVVSPNGDGYADVATIAYTLTEPSTVTLTLDDTSGLPVIAVTTLARQKAGSHVQALDLTDVPDGRYTVALMVRGDSGATSELSRPLTIMRGLAWLRADPPELSPNGDGVGDSILVSFELGEGGQVAVDVRSQGLPVAVLYTGWLDAGSHALSWDGSAMFGMIPPGSYEVWVSLSDAVGTVTQKVPITVAAPAG